MFHKVHVFHCKYFQRKQGKIFYCNLIYILFLSFGIVDFPVLFTLHLLQIIMTGCLVLPLGQIEGDMGGLGVWIYLFLEVK